MAFKAVLIGVNKHLDPAFSELVGARRDATHLWALFSDTMLGLGTFSWTNARRMGRPL